MTESEYQDLAEQVVEESAHIPDFGYWGDVPLGETWGFTISQNRDSGPMERSNWEVITEDMEKRFPKNVEIVHSSHWAVGWVEQLAVRMLDKRGKVTKAGKAILDWKESLENYPVADEEHFSDLEYNEFVEYIEQEYGADKTEAILNYIDECGYPFNYEGMSTEDLDDVAEFAQDLDLREQLADDFGEKNVEAALKWIDDNEMIHDLGEWDDAELNALWKYMGGKRPYTEAEERKLGQRFMFNPRRKRRRRRR